MTGRWRWTVWTPRDYENLQRAVAAHPATWHQRRREAHQQPNVINLDDHRKNRAQQQKEPPVPTDDDVFVADMKYLQQVRDRIELICARTGCTPPAYRDGDLHLISHGAQQLLDEWPTDA